MPNDNFTTFQSNAKVELSAFYKQGLPGILKSMFLKPTEGTRSLFDNASSKAVVNSLILMGVAFVLSILISLIIFNGYASFGTILGFGFSILIFLLLVSVACYGVKAAMGSANLKNELLNGGLCAVPMIGLMLVMLLAKLMGGDSLGVGGMGMLGLVNGSNIFLSILSLYFFLMLINITLQSLKSGGVKDAASWYLAPAIVLLSLYISFKITGGMF